VIGQFSGPYSLVLSCKSLNFSFAVNCVLNDFKLTPFVFKVLQKFEAVQRE